MIFLKYAKPAFITLPLVLASFISPAQDSLLAAYHDPDLFEAGKSELFDEAWFTRQPGLAMLRLINHNHQVVAVISVLPGQPATKNGKLEGFHGEKDAWLVAHFTLNQLDGAWQTWYPNRAKCDSGYIKNNIPDGVWRFWYPNGKMRFEANFSAGRYAEIKQRMDELMKRNLQSKSISGRFGDGNLAFYKEVYDNMLKAVTPAPISGPASLLPLFERLQFNDSSSTWGYIPPFNQGVLDGAFISYHPDGSVADSGFYQEGARTGEWVETRLKPYSMGKGQYRKGVRSGDWNFYDVQGRLQYTERYTRNGRYKGRVE